jgi:aminopeptidase N
MENFASKYIEFPFVKYGMNAVQPFYYGGMEHQTMTTINRSWLRNMYYYWNKQTQAYQGYNVYYSNLQGIAHELSHMWTGDLITCATWHDIWINEGGATWSEAIWSEGLWGLDAYYSNMLGKKNTYLNYGGLSLPSNYDVSFADVFNGGLTYAKGGWIWHMLRTMLGDSVYFPAFRNLLHRDGYTSVETEDIKKSFEMDVPNPPVSFETYFDQWIYKAGHPIYDITYSSINVGPNNYKITVNINQTQDTSGNISRIPYVFIMPITFMSYEKDSIKHYDTLINNQRNQTAEFYLPFKPDSIQLDERLILCEVKSIVSTVKEISDNSYTDNISIYPNPIYSGNEGNYSLRLNNYSNLSAEIYDELGNRVQTIYQGFLPTGTYSLNFSTSNLATGVYILNCKTRDKVFSHSFSVIK